MSSKYIFTLLLSLSSQLCLAQNRPEYQALEIELHNIPGKIGEEIRYGYDIIVNTPHYYGPTGILKKNPSARMSCNQCHMLVGTKPFGNSWLDTHALYPQYRGREGKIQTLSERINVCFKHPMQIKPIPEDSREMKAILLYFKWLGRGRKIPESDNDDRLVKLEFLSRAADPEKGKVGYIQHCIRCHGDNGQGQLAKDGPGFLYPPLWGDSSYVKGSSMSRLSILARFIKQNMPFDRQPTQPQLTDEESWDIAAYVSSHPRKAHKGNMFPKIQDKPFDFPIGPFDDSFSMEQHLYGPFPPIFEFWKQKSNAGANGLGLGI